MRRERHWRRSLSRLSAQVLQQGRRSLCRRGTPRLLYRDEAGDGDDKHSWHYNEYDISIAERAATLAAAANGGLPPLVMIDSNAGFVAAGNGADLY